MLSNLSLPRAAATDDLNFAYSLGKVFGGNHTAGLRNGTSSYFSLVPVFALVLSGLGQVMDDLTANKYQFAEYRLSIYGRSSTRDLCCASV